MEMVRSAPSEAQDGTFIVCGLGSLGRQCIDLLKEFGVVVVGVDRDAKALENETLAAPLDMFVVGDGCQAQFLLKAGIEKCRAILLVTSDERTNIAAAFTARSLNPHVRLIIRSAQNNLNALLRAQLGNLVAFEPSQFSADAFALASLSDDTQALFEVAGVKVRVGRDEVGPDDDGRLGRPVSELISARRRILSHTSGDEKPAEFFFPPNVSRTVCEGDVLTFVESAPFSNEAASRKTARLGKRGPMFKSWRAALAHWFERLRGGSRIPKTALVSFAIMFSLTLLGILLFHLENPDISWFDATNVAIVLAIGGFDNVFGALKLPFPISRGLYVFSVILTIASTVFLGVVFATLTGVVLSARLQIAHRRRAAPASDHTIVVGMGDIGQKIAEMLNNWRQPLVGVSEEPVEAGVLPDIAMQIGPMRDALLRANVEEAKSAIVVLDDQVANLEVSLLVRSLNPDCKVVFRTADQQLARDVAALIPSSTGISDYFIAAEAIAGAAFGENILSAFHLDNRSALVTEYTICDGDTLSSRQVADIAYGYGVAPILHRRGEAILFNPSDDVRLEADDTLVVLATVDGLRRVEYGERLEPDWFLWIDSSPNSEASFAAANTMARVSGCSLATARKAMSDLPTRLEVALYQPQGVRLARELRKLLVMSRLEQVAREELKP